MKRLTLLIVTIALLASACGASRDDSEVVAAEFLASLSAPEAAAPATTAPPPSVPPGCVQVTERDEYGFEVEVLDCGERPDPGIENPDWLGSDSAKLAGRMLREAIVDQAECGTRASYGELKTLVIDAIPEYKKPLLEAVAALEQGAAHCNKDKDAWAAAMSEAIRKLERFLRAVTVRTARLPHKAPR